MRDHLCPFTGVLSQIMREVTREVRESLKRWRVEALKRKDGVRQDAEHGTLEACAPPLSVGRSPRRSPSTAEAGSTLIKPVCRLATANPSVLWRTASRRLLARKNSRYLRSFYSTFLRRARAPPARIRRSLRLKHRQTRLQLGPQRAELVGQPGLYGHDSSDAD